MFESGTGLSRSCVLGCVRSSKVLIGPEPGPEGRGPGAVFTGLETLDGPDAGQAGLDAAGDTGTGGPMITGLALLTVTGPAGGAITVETGALETHELQAGLAAP